MHDDIPKVMCVLSQRDAFPIFVLNYLAKQRNLTLWWPRWLNEARNIINLISSWSYQLLLFDSLDQLLGARKSFYSLPSSGHWYLWFTALSDSGHLPINSPEFSALLFLLQLLHTHLFVPCPYSYSNLNSELICQSCFRLIRAVNEMVEKRLVTIPLIENNGSYVGWNLSVPVHMLFSLFWFVVF